ncbi:MAG: S-layer homology domain-containing protein [Firmicutes bacterium]|nr:S-layer homology domain-containing protein [Bacillota bacterium]
MITDTKRKISLFLVLVLSLVSCISFQSFGAGSVRFILTGDTQHSEGAHLSYETWVDTTVDLEGDNADVLMNNALTSLGYEVGYSYGYLDSVTSPGVISLGSGTNGNNSGWMFMVNGEIPPVGMSDYVLNDGDVFEVFYVDDYMAEIYGYTLTIEPSDANVTIYDKNGDVVEKSPWGDYYALTYGNYTYSATLNGKTALGSFTVNSPTPLLKIESGINTLNFKLTTDSVHSEGEHKEYVTAIDEDVTYNTGVAFTDIFKTVLANKNYSCEFNSYNFLDSVTDPQGVKLGSYTNGANSGWMFKVNGTIPDYGMDSYVPTSGDKVEVFYVDDYMAEIYGYSLALSLTPENIDFSIYDKTGNKVEKSPWGDYYALIYGDYTYTASKEGYVTKKGSFTVNTPTPALVVALSEASAENVKTGIPEIAQAPTADDTSSPLWRTKLNVGYAGFSGIAEDDGYIYNAANNVLRKIDKTSGAVVKEATLLTSIGYNYFLGSSNESIFVQLSDGRVQAFNKELVSLWVSEAPSFKEVQGISPIYCDGNYLYAATLSTNPSKGYGCIYCVSLEDEDSTDTTETKNILWQFTPDSAGNYAGFYWSGACPVGDKYIAIGSENGNFYVLNKATGAQVSALKVSEAAVRTTPVYYEGSLYFTSYDGYVNKVTVNEATGELSSLKRIKVAENAVSSSGKCVVYNNKVYVGSNGSGYSLGYISVIDSELKNILYSFETSGSVTANPFAATKYGVINVYFTVNSPEGPLYILTDSGEDISISNYYLPEGEYAQYCIHSPLVDENGTLFYQNDSGYLTALKKNTAISEETSTEVTSSLTETSTEETTRHYSSGGGGGGSSSSFVTISACVIGDDLHPDSAHKNYVYWADERNYTFSKGTTVSQALKKLFDDASLTCDGLESGYIRSVTSADGVTLGEFDNGVNSGWVYTINGSQPNKAINEYVLSNGDVLVFCYVDDYTKETGSSKVRTGSDEETSTTEVTETTTEEVPESVTYENTEVITSNPSNFAFDDVEEDYFAYTAINELSQKGILKGREEGLFLPKANITRAEVTALLYRLSNAEGRYSHNFKDVEEGAWYENYVAWAYEKGYVKGTSSDTFAPDEYITRQDLCCILERYTDLSAFPQREYPEFKDEKEISSYAKTAVETLYKASIINGYPDGTFAPKDNITRAETAVMIYAVL